MTDPTNQPDVISSNEPATPIQNDTSNNRRKAVGGIAAFAVVAAIAGGGAYAYSMLNSSGDYPYNHMADGAFGYVQTNMDPSAGQKLAINDLAKKFPELKAEDGDAYSVFTAENINAAFVAEALGSDKKYEWIGDRVAIAAYPDNDDEDTDPQLAVLFETTDAFTAEDDLDALLKDINESEDYTQSAPEDFNTEEMPEMEPVEPVEPGMPETETPGTDPNMPEMTDPDLDGDGQISPNEEALMEQIEESATQTSFTSEDPGSPVMPMDVEVDETKFVGKVYDGKWVGVTDGDLADYFEAESTLADNESFVDRIEGVQGNVVSAYVDLDGFTAAVEAAEEEFPGVTGEAVATVEVRDDGVDVSSEMWNVKLDGAVFGPQGDGAAVTKLLEDNAYSDAVFNLAIAGLGESVQKAMEGSEGAYNPVDEEVTSEDIAALLGDQASLSVKGDRVENLEGKVVLKGVDEAKWNEYLAREGVTPEQLSEMASEELGKDMTFTIENDELVIVVGAGPDGGQSFDEGVVTGSVNLDDIASIIHNLSFFGETPEGDAPKDLGEIKFYSTSDEDGNGKSMASWTTPR